MVVIFWFSILTSQKYSVPLGIKMTFVTFELGACQKVRFDYLDQLMRWYYT